MKNMLRRTSIAAAVAFTALMTSQSISGRLDAAGATEPDWTAVAASGRVETNLAGSCMTVWERLGRGDAVPAMSRIRTQERSRATLTRGGDIVLMSARSEVLLPRVADGDAMVIRQNAGRTLYQFEPRTQGSVEIVTPYLVAGVKGTTFSVIVEEEYSSVSVVSGHVEVRSLLTGIMVDLFAGDMALIEARDGALSVHSDRAEAAHLVPPGVSTSRKDTGELVRLAARDDVEWEEENTDLWEDFADETWLDTRQEMILDREKSQMEDDQVLTKAEEDARNVICRQTKCN